jgi:hypothetical protein
MAANRIIAAVKTSDFVKILFLVVRVPGYRSRGSGIDSWALQEKKKWVWNGVHSVS